MFVPAAGQYLDTRFGDPTQLTVAASPSGLLTAGDGAAPRMSRELACRRSQPDRGIPGPLVKGAPDELVLDLARRLSRRKLSVLGVTLRA